MFYPTIGQKIKINSNLFSIVEHPNAPGIPFGHEGRHATVYKVIDTSRNGYALKVYKPNYRFASNLQTIKLAEFSSLPGLTACAQTVIMSETNMGLVNNFPDLEYAILMPWIDGKTWQEALPDKLSISDSRVIARNLANILCDLERLGVAHCDLSGGNTIINLNAMKENKPIVSLIDFDHFFEPRLPKPKNIPRGTFGYSHITQQSEGTWEAKSDRFAGAVLLTEMLIFHDDRVHYSSYGESYFSNDELQLLKTNRFPLAIQVLREQGDIVVAELFEKAWFSKSLNDCPSLCEWANAIAYPASTPLELVKNINKQPTLEAKCTIVGQGSVGKTSLIQRIVHDTFDEKQSKTEGISINLWRVGADFETYTLEGRFYKRISDAPIRLNIWDFGGQEIMHTTHQFFLTKRSLYLLVIDSRLTQEENRVEYWLKIIQFFGGASPVLIVGNKIDQHPLDIDRTGLQKKYPNIVGIFETSAATGAGIEKLRDAIAVQANNLPHVRDLLPETWFAIKTQLEVLGREANFITHDKYLELCAKNEVSDEASQRTLIGFMHDLGVVLYFQEDRRLSDLGILNPQWVTNGVYKILNSHTLFQNKGVLTVSMLDEILNLPEYPRGKRFFIVDMMKKFELCYDIDGYTFLIPDLLPKDEPYTGEWDGALAFKYNYGVLPASIMSRFIVKMKDFVHQPSTWRSGTILKKDGNTALVKADFEDRTISIKAQGTSNTRRDMLSLIRGTFEIIHKSVSRLEVTQQVPHPQHHNLILDYEELIEFEREGVMEFPRKVDGKVIKINVREMLNGLESEIQRKEKSVVVNNFYSAGDGGVIVGRDFSGNLIAGDDNQIIQDS